MDWTARALAVRRELLRGGGWDLLDVAMAALAAEAYQAGIQKHVEHHRCERCHAAGVAVVIEWMRTHDVTLYSSDEVAAALRTGRGE